MKPLFTIHAGEYLAAEHIERTYRHWNVWIPSKDTGIDLLLTSPETSKTVSLQIKFSKDFVPTQKPLLQNCLLAAGWWTHDRSKIKRSKADFWIFVLPSFVEKQTSFIILPPAELLRRFNAIHGTTKKSIHSYLQVTRTKHCWESRGLTNADQKLLAADRFSHSSRDFSKFLNGWEQIEKKLK